MTQIILMLIAIVIVGVLIYVASRPNDFQIQRSTTIKATPEKLFPLINDLHNMQTWSAWEKVDPQSRQNDWWQI